METNMDIMEISETLSAAHEYLNRLKNLSRQLQSAEKQVETTAEDTARNIEVTFANLLNSLTSALSDRKKQLLQQAKKVKSQGIAPLRDCQNIIANKLEQTQEFIGLGELLCRNGNMKSAVEFRERASLLGSLPEVPDLKEVPFISFNLEETVRDDILLLCLNLGSVSQIAPVQISYCIENPGALLIGWECIVGDDCCSDIQEFRLQKAFGNVLEELHLEANFKDCYRGTDIQYLVKDLIPQQDYSFRVCCKYESSSTWSRWSHVHVAKTKIFPYCWKQTEGFALTNDNQIAKPINNTSQILLSDGPQYKNGFCIDFTFLECDNNGAESTYVGLSTSEDVFGGEGCFYVDNKGRVHIDGIEKITHLPEVNRGSKISFVCDDSFAKKMRVNVDVVDKRVTYDWNVATTKPFYFFIKFGSCKWKIMVD